MSDQTIFILMIFFIGFLMTQAFVAPLMGSSRKARRRLRERIRDLSTDQDAQRHVSLVRDRYLKELSPLELKLLSLPGMDDLQRLIDQAGSSQLPHRLVLTGLVTAIAAGVAAGLMLGWGLGAALIGVTAGAMPFLLLRRKRAQRLARFEEQLPDALTVASRALRAGMPFNEAINLVAQEIREPAGKEFGIVFTEINYGGDVRAALLGLLERVPSVAVMATVTSVLVQRETGGNLAELLDKLADVVRKRFRFQRTVRTLSADGRLSAWIMALIPFVIAAAMTVTMPGFLNLLIDDPAGPKLIMLALAFMTAGILWMQQIVRIDV
jgi:tight adherence protein B